LTASPRHSEWITIGELARRTGVSTDALRAWERRYALLQPRRTAGNRRLYSRADEARVGLMRRYLGTGMPAAQAAEQVAATRLTVNTGHGAAVAPHEIRAAHDELRAALDGFRETPAQRVLERLLGAHSRLAVIRDVLLPYLREVGDRWAEGHTTIAQEHFASTFVEARLLAMARGWDRGAGPLALLAAPSGERHVFGLLSFGIALHGFGWRITYLGSDTPIHAIASAADVVRPDLIAVAAATPDRLGPGRDLRALAGRWACAIAGPGTSAEIAREFGARHLAEDPVTAAEALYAG
jgi:MerR family transcriptional regulator, light-induced transcriptional regulator